MAAELLPSPAEILEFLPQQRPFRFVDELTEVSELAIAGRYRFRPDEFFYQGHFPGRPITPGVILLECMCQIGIVAHGVYLFAHDFVSGQGATGGPAADWRQDAKLWTTFFADAETEFFAPVLPGELVEVRAERIFWRRRKLRSRIGMFRNGQRVAQATASGIGVRNES